MSGGWRGRGLSTKEANDLGRGCLWIVVIVFFGSLLLGGWFGM